MQSPGIVLARSRKRRFSGRKTHAPGIQAVHDRLALRIVETAPGRDFIKRAETSGAKAADLVDLTDFDAR